MAEMNQEFFKSAMNDIVHGKINYINVAGIEPELFEERHVVGRLPLSSMHMNHVGMLYAGSFFVFGEAMGASLIKCTYAGAYVPIIKSVSIDYKKPALKDIVIDISMTEEEAEERIAYVKEHGKGQYPMDIPVKDADGVEVCVIHIVYYLMKK